MWIKYNFSYQKYLINVSILYFYLIRSQNSVYVHKSRYPFASKMITVFYYLAF